MTTLPTEQKIRELREEVHEMREMREELARLRLQVDGISAGGIVEEVPGVWGKQLNREELRGVVSSRVYLQLSMDRLIIH